MSSFSEYEAGFRIHGTNDSKNYLKTDKIEGHQLYWEQAEVMCISMYVLCLTSNTKC